MSRHPLLIIGLDGGTFDIVDPLAGRGLLPTLGRLAASGLRTELRSTLPPATLPAWTSFLTGCNPGCHGVTDLFVRPPHSYALEPASGRLRAIPTFLRRLSDLGLSVASVGVPGTFPPEPVGVCVAGFDAPGSAKALPRSVWPPALGRELNRAGGWRYAVFNENARAPLAAAVRALLADIDDKERVILSLFRRARFDLFFVHLQASDTAAHHLWHTFDRASPRAAHPELAGALPRVYARLDALIGRLLAAASPETRVLVVSDHGMGGAAATALYLNRWLAQQGLVTFRSGAGRLPCAFSAGLEHLGRRMPPSLSGAILQRLPTRWSGALLGTTRTAALDLAKCAAFSDELDYAPSIWIHRRALFPKGRVGESEVEALRERIVQALLAWRAPGGHRLIAAVHPREKNLRGPFVARAPDLLIEPAWIDGYRPSFLPSPGPGPVHRILSQSEYDAPRGAGLAGVHRREGLFIAWGPGLPAMEIPALEIAQAGALVYPLLGYPVPAEIEARPPAFLGELLGISGEEPTASRQAAASAAPYTAAERVELVRRLKDLGYLG